MRLDFKQFIFGKREKPSYSKFNTILNVLEGQRLSYGPYSFEIDTAAITGFRVKLTEDIDDAGGVVASGADTITRRKFNIEFEGFAQGTLLTCRWDNVQFIKDTSDNEYYFWCNGLNQSIPTDRGFGAMPNVSNADTAAETNIRVFSAAYSRYFRWGTYGVGIQLMGTGGTPTYIFVTEAGGVRRFQSLPTSDADGTAM